MSREERKTTILRHHPDLSLSRQCRLLSIGRSSFYYAPKGESPENLAHHDCFSFSRTCAAFHAVEVAKPTF